jgi:protein-S-isoprenylcysteine O-methyltransferase Ste14
MKATEFEFRHRFWFIMAIYTVGFWCYAFDHVNVAQAMLQMVYGYPLQDAANRHHLQAIFTLAAVSALLAAVIRTWAAAYLQSEVVHDPNLHTERLVASGPYRFVRNPLYLGGVLLALGFAALASRVGFFVIVVGQTAFYYRLIVREEGELLKTQGDSYRRFLAAVPALIPSLTPRLPSGDRQAHWGQGLLGELFLFFFAASIAAFARTLSHSVLYVAIGLALAARGITLALIRWNKRRQEPLTAPPAP